MGELDDEIETLIVHPWIVQLRGGERTFFEIARAFPKARLGLLFSKAQTMPPDIRARDPSMTFLQAFPLSAVPYRALAPLLPIAAATLNGRARRVISSSSGWAHLIRPRPGGIHLCYMHTPPRYLWWDDELPLSRVARFAATGLRPWLRKIDADGAKYVTAFAANSSFTASRIKAIYGRDAEVIYPPAEIDSDQVETTEKGDFALTVAELVPYKRVDLAIAAADRAHVSLVIVGDGPERKRLKSQASSRIQFLGRVEPAVLKRLFQRARVFLHPAVEDFGIVMVEALANGTPVVGVNAGGAAEIVATNCGFLAAYQSEAALAVALSAAWEGRFNPEVLKWSARRFSTKVFRERFRTWIANQTRLRLHDI